MDFFARPPSTAWEVVPVPHQPACVIWVWFKPATAVGDVLFQIPPETHAACGPLSMRQALQMSGIPIEQAAFWTIQGTPYPVEGGNNPLLDHPLPPPGPWGASSVSVRMQTAGPVETAPPHIAGDLGLPPPGPVVPMPHGPGSAVPDDRGLDAFAADWQALLALEAQLSSVRKQLGATQGQLQSLNRDFSPDERLVADNQDKKDWQDARRWLRDSLATVSRWIRDHDIGMVSAAGNRNRFEQIYQEYVVPKKPFPGLAGVGHEFEQHRKTAQNLLVQMQSAHQNASRDGVNRARQVLNRVAAKVRKSKEKRGTR